MIELDKIYNEDCLEGMKRIPDGSVNLIVTDPPYIVSRSRGGSVNNIKKLNVSLQDLDVAKLRDGYNIAAFAEHVKRLQGNRINAYFWCNKIQIPDYLRTYVDGLKCKFEIIAWHKQNALPTYYNKYLSDTEYCLYFHTGGFTHPANYEDAKTYEVGYINHEDKRKWGHPTIKPLPIIQRIVRNSSQAGSIVLDPFIDSGTTAIAAMREGRHFIGFELNEEYFGKAVERIERERKAMAAVIQQQTGR